LNCYLEDGFSPTKDLRFIAPVESLSAAGELQILRLRLATTTPSSAKSALDGDPGHRRASAQDDNSIK